MQNFTVFHFSKKCHGPPKFRSFTSQLQKICSRYTTVHQQSHRHTHNHSQKHKTTIFKKAQHRPNPAPDSADQRSRADPGQSLSLLSKPKGPPAPDSYASKQSNRSPHSNMNRGRPPPACCRTGGVRRRAADCGVRPRSVASGQRAVACGGLWRRAARLRPGAAAGGRVRPRAAAWGSLQRRSAACGRLRPVCCRSGGVRRLAAICDG